MGTLASYCSTKRGWQGEGPKRHFGCKENARLPLLNSRLTLLVKGKPKVFNDFHFGVFVDFYNMKGNDAYSKILNAPQER